MDLFTLAGNIVINGVDKVEKSLSGITKKAGDTAKTLGSKMESAGKSMQKVGDSVSKVGKAFLPASTAIVGIGTAAVSAYASFEEKMSNVQAISGATGEDLQKLADKAKEMGRTTKFSASESADALSYMAMAGWKTDQMLDGLPGIMNLAAASGSDLATTSDIVTDALTGMGYGAESAGQLADVMAAASSNANTNVELMGETFKYIAPVIGAMGYSMEDAALATGLMANAGIKGSNAGTALRTMLTNMAKPTDAMAAAMDVLGVSLSDDEGNMKSLREVMDDLRSGFGQLMIPQEEYDEEVQKLNKAHESGELTTKKYNKAVEELMERAYGAEGAEKAKYAAMLAGKEGMSGMLSIVNATTEDYDKLANAIDGSSGAAEDMATTMNDNLKGQITILKSGLEGLGIQIGEIVVPYIKEFVDFLQSLVDRFSQVDEKTMRMILTIAGIVAALGPALIMVGKVISAVGSITEWIGKATGSIGGLLTKLGAVSAPMIAVVAVVGILIGAFVTLWNTNEGFRNAIISTWNKIKDTLSGFFDGIKERLNAVGITFDSVGSAIKTIWMGLCDVLAPLFEGAFNMVASVLSTVLDVITGILDVFIGIFTGNWSQAWDGVKNIFSSIWNGLVDRFKIAIDTIKGVADVILGWFGTSWNEVWSGISSFFIGIWTTVSSFFSGVWTTITNVVQTGIMLIGSILNAAFQIITLPWQFIWQNCGDTIMKIWETIKKTVSDAVNAVANVVNKVTTGIKNAVLPIWESISKGISKVFNTIKDVASTVWNGIKTTIGGIVDGIKSKVTTVFDGVKNNVSDVFGKIKSGADNVWEGIKKAITTPVNAAKDAVKKAVDAIKGFFDKMDLQLPKIKLPHFKVEGKLSISPPSVPKLSIDWYKDGGILERPTIFGMNGSSLMGGGEAGKEAVAPIDQLQGYIRQVMAEDRSDEQIVTLLRQLVSWLMGGGFKAVLIDVLVNCVTLQFENREVARMVRKYA